MLHQVPVRHPHPRCCPGFLYFLQIPFFLWNAALVSIYAVSLVQLQGMQGPLASLNMASKVTYRFSRWVPRPSTVAH